MRKKVVILFIVFFHFSVNAQNIRYGIRTGLNLSNFKGEIDQENFNALLGFQFGGFAEYKITDEFSIQSELNYSIQGAKYNFSYTTSNYYYFENGKYILNYVNIPILVKYYITEDISIIGGTQTNILLNAKMEYNVNGESNVATVKEIFKTSNFNFTLGACYNITKNILLDARYNVGLTSIEKDYNVKNNLAQLSIGYVF